MEQGGRAIYHLFLRETKRSQPVPPLNLALKVGFVFPNTGVYNRKCAWFWFPAEFSGYFNILFIIFSGHF